ncbi:hypothetical protein CDAR_204091 [Caerostris darwini]|uniref:Uncharacterized protein n=1 Tax=Caerostris darwini TaxID=1538125 RepID=A0AAV4QNL9_9ARAC|nr:hypothetical protein CDAR_204091 [Caerostris darwini]
MFLIIVPCIAPSSTVRREAATASCVEGQLDVVLGGITQEFALSMRSHPWRKPGELSVPEAMSDTHGLVIHCDFWTLTPRKPHAAPSEWQKTPHKILKLIHIDSSRQLFLR